jgi:KaiC/GvpD/RAD55 family RecA-like ATPase
MSEDNKLPCPDTDNCQSSDAYSWNTEDKKGYCHSCRYSQWEFKGKVYGRRENEAKGRLVGAVEAAKVTTPADDMSFTSTAVASTGATYTEMRGIKASTMEKFGVKTDGNNQMYVYPSGGVKTRFIAEKDFSAVGLKMTELFGMNLFPANCSKKVVVVEGELDAMSAWQMLSAGSSYVNAVVSLPSASPSGKLWENCHDWLDSFDEIILSVDNDKAGDRVAETMFDLFPSKVMVMNHGIYKDANDFLQAGDQAAYKSAYWSAKKYSPAGFTSSVEDWMSAIDGEDPYEYVPTPILAYNKIGKGLVKGGITILKALPGTGKSSFLRKLMHNLVVEKDKVVAAQMMEEVKSVTGRAMAGYQLSMNVKTKEDAANNGVTEDEVKAALREVLGVTGERFISFDINPQDPIQDTLKQCKHAITVYGAEYIFIDHLQRLAYLMGTEGATASLTELGVKLTELAKRRNVGIVCISHVNSEGRTKYASSIEEEAIVVIEMKRDMQSEDLEERNTVRLSITKNRPYALTGPAGMLRYDVDKDMVFERLGPQEPVTVNTEDF